jgi:hypothetical protein
MLQIYCTVGTVRGGCLPQPEVPASPDTLHHEINLYAVQMLGLLDDHDYDLSRYPKQKASRPADQPPTRTLR